MNIHGKIDVFGTACCKMTNEELAKKFTELAITSVEDDSEKPSKIHKVCKEIVWRFVLENTTKNLDIDEKITGRFVRESTPSIDYYKLENGKCLAVDTNSSNGFTMKAWYCNDAGVSTDEPAFKVEEVYIPVSIDEDGEPYQYEFIGFNIKH